MTKIKKNDLKNKKEITNQKHIEFYDKAFDILNFIFDEYSRELTRVYFQFLL